MGLPQERYYTMEDIDNLPEGTHAELIDGRIYYMSPSPSRSHQKISGDLYYQIRNYIQKGNGKCEVYSAPFAVFLNADDTTYLEPDISVICDPNKLNDKGCNGAPDWIIEIVSPSNASHDYVLKLNKYMLAGVREYWIVDPQAGRIQVYFFEGNIMAHPYSFSDKVKVNIYDDFEIDFAQLSL